MSISQQDIEDAKRAADDHYHAVKALHENPDVLHAAQAIASNVSRFAGTMAAQAVAINPELKEVDIVKLLTISIDLCKLSNDTALKFSDELKMAIANGDIDLSLDGGAA